jgi:DNA-directed RNA polymerase subunit H (RpoH/RPB5)
METPEENYSIYKWGEISENDVLFRAKANQVHMLSHRGYNVPDDELRQYSWDNIEEYKRKRARFKRRAPKKVHEYLSGFYHKDSPGETVYVAFIYEQGKASISVQMMNKVIAKLAEAKVRRLIIISPHAVHQDALKFLADSETKVEIYPEKSMCINRLDHVFNPKIQVLSPSEKKAFFDETGLSGKKIAKYASCTNVATCEPILQHYQHPKGTVVKIFRDNDFTNQVCKESVYWRVVT